MSNTRFVTVRVKDVEPEIVLEVLQRIQGGRSCIDLVEDQKISKRALDRVRGTVMDFLRGELALDSPEDWQTMEMARLLDIERCAAEQYELTKDHKLLGLRLKASESRRKLLGIDAPERKVVEIQERPKELMADILSSKSQPAAGEPPVIDSLPTIQEH